MALALLRVEAKQGARLKVSDLG